MRRGGLFDLIYFIVGVIVLIVVVKLLIGVL
jgi:hypothetical protein